MITHDNDSSPGSTRTLGLFRRLVVGEVELLDPAIEPRAGRCRGSRRRATCCCGTAAGPVSISAAFDLGQQLVERLDRAGAARAGCRRRPGCRGSSPAGPPAAMSGAPAARAWRVLDDAGQLGEVPGPVVGAAVPRWPRGENPIRCAAPAPIGALEEVLRQGRQLVAALAQRGEADHQRRHRVIQLRAAAARPARRPRARGSSWPSAGPAGRAPRPAGPGGRGAGSGPRRSAASSRRPARAAADARGVAWPSGSAAPNSSRSRISAGSASQSNAMNGRWRSGPCWWIVRATCRFPVPGSPTISTGTVEPAASRICSSSRRCAGPKPIRASRP